MKKDRTKLYFNSTCYSLVWYYKGYSIRSSTFVKWVLQVRDFAWVRIVWYCTRENLDRKIQALDTYFTFYSS